MCVHVCVRERERDTNVLQPFSVYDAKMETMILKTIFIEINLVEIILIKTVSGKGEVVCTVQLKIE